MDRELARRLARYCELAYEAPVAVAAALPEAKVSLLDHDHTQAYVIETPAHRVVAFRGTQVFSGFCAADVLSNVWFRRKAWPPGAVHRGYREAILDIAGRLEPILRDAAAAPLYFTGHSLGGALATLASTLAPGPQATYTFGAPRVGDAAFAAHLRNLYRIVHGDDIAPKYPLPLGYRHGGEAWHLSEDGRLSKGVPFWRHLVLPVLPHGLAKGVLDHRIRAYVEKL